MEAVVNPLNGAGYATYLSGVTPGSGPSGPTGPTGPAGPTGSSGGGGAGGTPILALNFVLAADIAGLSVPATTWTALLAAQSFSVTSATSLVEVIVVGSLNTQAIYCATAVLIDVRSATSLAAMKARSAMPSPDRGRCISVASPWARTPSHCKSGRSLGTLNTAAPSRRQIASSCACR